MSFKAVIFDLDGTLLDTLGDISGAVGHALSRFCFSPLGREDVRARIGDGAYKLLERSMPDGSSAEDITRAVEYFRAYYADHYMVHTELYEGILPLLATLKAAGIPMAVASNKDEPFVKALVDKFFPDTFLAACGKTGERRRKPYGDIAEAALTPLGVEPEEVLFVGDSVTDKRTAAACGFGFMYVTWGYGYPEDILPAPTAKKAEDIGKFILSAT